MAFALTTTGCPQATEPNESDTVDVEFGTANRYIGFSIKDTALEFIRVTMVALDPPHDVCNGQQKCVGEPWSLTELSGETGPLPARYLPSCS